MELFKCLYLFEDGFFANSFLTVYGVTCDIKSPKTKALCSS